MVNGLSLCVYCKVYVLVCLFVSMETNPLVIIWHCFYIGLTTVSSCTNLIAILAQDMMGEAKIEPKSNVGYSLNILSWDMNEHYSKLNS